MAWWDVALDAVGAVAGAIGDAVETVVDTVVDVVDEVVETGFEWTLAALDRARDGIAAFSPALGVVGNLVLGLVKGVVQLAKDVVRIALDVVRHAGEFVNALLHLNLPRMIDALLGIVINAGELVAAAIRLVLGGYFAGPVSDYFMRDRHIATIRSLIIEEFGKDADTILVKLGYGTAYFRLPIACEVRVMVMDSTTFPMAEQHSAGTFDLFAMAGLLSTESFAIFAPRTKVVMVGEAGQDLWWRPITRPDIKDFLDSGGTSCRLRCYALEPDGVGRAMRTAHNKFKKLCIDLSFDASFHFPTWQTYATQPCVSLDDYHFTNFNAWFSANTPQNGAPRLDGRPLSITTFKCPLGVRGITSGRSMLRWVEDTNGCPWDNMEERCMTTIEREIVFPGLPDQVIGSGVIWRDQYPPWFGRLVLGHELGHYFGLTHAGHDGVENTMFSLPEGNDLLGGGSWRLWSHGEPVFTDVDVEHVWRFTIKRMRHVLEAL